MLNNEMATRNIQSNFNKQANEYIKCINRKIANSLEEYISCQFETWFNNKSLLKPEVLRLIRNHFEENGFYIEIREKGVDLRSDYVVFHIYWSKAKEEKIKREQRKEKIKNDIKNFFMKPFRRY